MEWIASVQFNALLYNYNAMQCKAKWLLITAACSNAMSGEGWLARTTIYDYPDNGESKKHKFVAHQAHTQGPTWWSGAQQWSGGPLVLDDQLFDA